MSALQGRREKWNQTWRARRAFDALQSSDKGALLQSEILSKEELIAAVQNRVVIVEVGCDRTHGERQGAGPR
jgi:hypothetical protein